MADKENPARVVTRAAKRKAEEIQPKPKKRAALSDLTNTSRDSNAGKSKNPKKPTEETKKQSSASVHHEEEVVNPEFEDPQLCVSFASDIYSYLHEMENNSNKRPKPDYMETVQKDITPNMRGILIDWLVEVADEYRLLPDTLYLTVNIIDRYLSSAIINRQKLQLLGVASMLIASKYEEIKPPNVEDFCYITDNTYTKEEVLKMEFDILNTLRFEFGNPTAKTFLRRLTMVAEEDFKETSLQLEFLCCYLAELSLLDYRTVKLLPSLVCASVIFLARFILRPRKHPWNMKLQMFIGLKPRDLRSCVLVLHSYFMNRQGEGFHAVKDKYKQHKFKAVALTPCTPEIPSCFFEDVFD